MPLLEYAPEIESDRVEHQLRDTILVVDDNQALLGLCRRVLERAGYAVICAESAPSALATAAGTRLDLVITDVLMPEMDGAAFAKRLAAQGATVPVLFMSGYTENAAIAEGRASKRSAFLPKPFAPGDLVRVVRQLLDEGASRRDRA